MDTEPDPRTAGLIRTQIGLLVKANIKTLWPIATASKLLFCVFACGLGIATRVLQLRGSCRQAPAPWRRFQPPGRGCAPADGRPGRPARRVCFVGLFRFHYCSFYKKPESLSIRPGHSKMRHARFWSAGLRRGTAKDGGAAAAAHTRAVASRWTIAQQSKGSGRHAPRQQPQRPGRRSPWSAQRRVGGSSGEALVSAARAAAAAAQPQRRRHRRHRIEQGAQSWLAAQPRGSQRLHPHAVGHRPGSVRGQRRWRLRALRPLTWERARPAESAAFPQTRVI